MHDESRAIALSNFSQWKAIVDQESRFNDSEMR